MIAGHGPSSARRRVLDVGQVAVFEIEDAHVTTATFIYGNSDA